MIITLTSPTELLAGDVILDAKGEITPKGTVVKIRKGRCEGDTVVWVTTLDGVEEPWWLGAIEVERPQTTVSSATTAEESLRIAFDTTHVIMPTALVGTTNINGAKNEVKIEVPAPAAPEVKPLAPAPLEEGETLIADLTDENLVFGLADDTVAEIIMISEDEAGTVWATYRTTDGVRDFVDSDRWAQVFGADVEADICEAWDRQTVKGLRHLVTA